MICLVSKNWDASYECKTEYRHAEDRGKPIFPVRLEPTSGRDITSEWQHCDLFGEGPKTAVLLDGGTAPVEFLTDGLERLKSGLRAIGIAPDTFRWPPKDDPHRSPYRGWQPLDAVDAAVYFGRDAEINRALTAIRALRVSGEKNACAILGPSGVGKSSFLRAGLLPRLQRDDRHFVTMEIVRPERHPLTGDLGLAKSIYALRCSLGLNEPCLGVIKTDADDPRRVRTWLVEAQSAAMDRFVNGSPPTAPTLILPVDQAEELFGAEVGAETDNFLAVISDLLMSDTSELPIMAVATIRTDRYELFQTAPQLRGLEPELFQDLKPMRPDRFREVICGPAGRLEAAGTKLLWAPEVVERLLQACEASADALPLLSLTLAGLYEDYGSDGEITLDEYESMGGMRRVVESVIDGLLSTDPDARRRELYQLRRAFIPWLATINPVNDVPLRRVARWFDLPADSHHLIDALVAKRLLVKDERDGDVVVEVALEILLSQWDALAGWLREEATDLKEADVLDQAARAWADNGFQDDWLLEGARLIDAETLAAKPGFRDRLNTAREYLLASRQREDQRTAAALREAREHQDIAEKVLETERRAKQDAQRSSVLLRRVLVFTAVVALLALIGGGWAWDLKGRANQEFLKETAQRLRAESLALLAGQAPSDDDVLALQLLLAARSIAPNLDDEANNTLLSVNSQFLSVLNQERDIVKIIHTPARVYSVGLSPDGRKIVAGSADMTVRLWDTETGVRNAKPWTGHDGQVIGVAFSPDGSRIASGSTDHTIRLWDSSGKQTNSRLVGHSGPVGSVAFNRDSTKLASGSTDGTVRIWAVADGTQIAELRGHSGWVNGVAWSPDGTKIVSGSADKTVRIWDAERQIQIAEMRGHQGDVVSVAWNPDGTQIASASKDGTVRIWDAERHTQIAEIRGHGDPVLSVAFSPDGTRIAFGSTDKTVRIWDAERHTQIAELRGHDAQVLSVAFSPDSQQVVSAAEDDTVRVWYATRWQPIPGNQPLQDAVFRAGSDRIVTYGDDNTVRLWDTLTGRPIGIPVPLEGVNQPRQRVGLDAGYALMRDSNGTVQLWDTAQLAGQPTRLVPHPVGGPLPASVDPTLVAYSPAGKIAAAVAEKTVQLYEAATMRLGALIRLNRPVTAIAITPDGGEVAIGEDDFTVRLWDAATGTTLGAPMKGDALVTKLMFSADGHTLAAWDLGGGTLRLWDTQRSQSIGSPLAGHGKMTAVAVSPDGHMVAVGGQFGVIQLWDTNDGNARPDLEDQNGEVTSLDFSPNGATLLSASTNGAARVWPIEDSSPAALSEALCKKLTENMSQHQWASHVPPGIKYRDLCDGLPRADDTGEAS